MDAANTGIDTRSPIASLRSTLCPVCGGKKRVANSLCYSCYRRLPEALKHALYQRVGEGYEEAMAEAFWHRGVLVPYFPAPREDSSDA